MDLHLQLEVVQFQQDFKMKMKKYQYLIKTMRKLDKISISYYTNSYADDKLKLHKLLSLIPKTRY